MSYEPSQEIVERYARVLVDFALGDGDGIKPGDTVRVVGSEETKPLFAEVCRAVWRSGGNVIAELTPDAGRALQPRARLLRARQRRPARPLPREVPARLLDEIDHLVYIDGSDYPQAMKDVDPQKMMRRQAAFMPMIAWQQEKEAAGSAALDDRPVGHRSDGGRGRAHASSSTGSRSSRPASSTTPTRSPAGARRSRRSTTTATGSTRCRSSGCTWRRRTSTCG